MISCTLRRIERSGDSSRFLTTCCVIVDPPCALPPAQHVGDERAHHAHVVQAAVVEVFGVLRRDHRLHQQLRDRVVGNQRPLLQAELADGRAVAVQDARHLLGPVRVQPAQVRQLRIAAVVGEHADQRRDRRERAQRRRRPARCAATRTQGGRSAPPRAAPALFPRARHARRRAPVAHPARVAIIQRRTGGHLVSVSLPARAFKKRAPRSATQKHLQIVAQSDPHAATRSSRECYGRPMLPAGERLLRADGLVVGYDGTPILPPLSATIGAGELWAVIGPNGAGKSTFVRTALGLVKPLVRRGRAQARASAWRTSRSSRRWTPSSRSRSSTSC